MTDLTTDTAIFELWYHIATVTLNRPEAMNALDPDLTLHLNRDPAMVGWTPERW